ncbi:MAG: SO2930 family diheme c-type cytochrome [Alphaproteobacteria bacterium]|nr:SO2930 family diheme c-type cytochrome [Alphaproteobacteria bacterium]
MPAVVIGLALLGAFACTQRAAAPDARAILAADPPPRLSDYGFFLDAAARQPASGVVAYDLVNPLFSDHASKHRLAYVPTGQAAAYDPNEVFDFPVGSVLIKTFAFAPDMRHPEKDERYIETRLLIRKADGWAAFPYVWNAEQTEASYAPVGGRQKIETITPDGEAVSIDYAIPNKNQCKTCHQSGDALMPIGPSARSLNHVGPHGANQLADWTARGMLAGAPAPRAAPIVPRAADALLSVELRARAYLDINCAHCHKADGSASNSGLFLRWTETDPTGWGVHKRPTAAGRGAGDDLFVIEPGAPVESILLSRMESTEPGVMMPELSRSLLDRQGIELVRDWIAAMPPKAE